MNKSTPTSRTKIQSLLPLMLMLISLSWSGCAGVKVISADQMETFIKAKQPFTPAVDGVFMPEARYQRYRQAVADAIQVQQNKAVAPK